MDREAAGTIAALFLDPVEEAPVPKTVSHRVRKRPLSECLRVVSHGVSVLEAALLR